MKCVKHTKGHTKAEKEYWLFERMCVVINFLHGTMISGLLATLEVHLSFNMILGS